MITVRAQSFRPTRWERSCHLLCRYQACLSLFPRGPLFCPPLFLEARSLEPLLLALPRPLLFLATHNLARAIRHEFCVRRAPDVTEVRISHPALACICMASFRKSNPTSAPPPRSNWAGTLAPARRERLRLSSLTVLEKKSISAKVLTNGELQFLPSKQACEPLGSYLGNSPLRLLQRPHTPGAADCHHSSAKFTPSHPGCARQSGSS